MPLSVNEVKTYCLHRLGYPVVEVELADEHYQSAFEQALRTVGFAMPRRVHKSFNVSTGVQVYTLTDFGLGVVDVQLPPPEYQVNQEFDLFNPRYIAHPLNIADYELGRVYAETAKKIMSVDPEWDFDIETGKLIISPVPSTSFQAVAVCLKEVRGQDIINPWLKQQSLKLSLAIAKQILGMIRRKVRQVEGTELTFELDGAELIAEGKIEEDEVTALLTEKSGDFVAPIWGNGP